jgi:hypothetical protein
MGGSGKHLSWTTCERGVGPDADDRNAMPMHARGGWWSGRLELVHSGRLTLGLCDAGVSREWGAWLESMRRRCGECDGGG